MNFQDHLIISPIVKTRMVFIYKKKKYFDSTGGFTGTISLDGVIKMFRKKL